MKFSSRFLPGFTLLEVLVATSLFASVGLMGTGVYLNLTRGQQQVMSRNLLYDDAQFILDKLSRDIATNGLDYEEYYNQIVLGGKPGMNFGHYASQFYYNTDKASSGCPDISQGKCSNIGKNPPTGNFPEKNNAFYKAGVEAPKIFCQGFDPLFSTGKNHACVTQLFLINQVGTKKTMIGREKIDWGSDKATSVLSRATMILAEDYGTLFPRLFRCVPGTCDKKLIITTLNVSTPPSLEVKYPDPDDLDNTDVSLTSSASSDAKYLSGAYNEGKNFVPFTPSRVDIEDIKFYVSPAEDPHRSYAESNLNKGTLTTVHQPKIIISLTIQPSSNVRYKTKHSSLTVQTTVTPGLFAEVASYPPQMVKNP